MSGCHGCTTTPTITRIGYPERELTTTFPSPPRCDSESVKASAAKPAIVETGAQVMVPLFLSIGEKIKIDTRSDSYLGRES